MSRVTRHSKTFYPSSITADERLILDYSIDRCYCFSQNPRYEGHTVNPPCESILAARELAVKLKKRYAKELKNGK